MTIPPEKLDIPSKEEVAEKTMEDAGQHTPTPTVPEAEHVPDKAPKGGETLDALRATVETLAQSVESLTNIVTSKIREKDTSPHSIPWTHRGGARE